MGGRAASAHTKAHPLCANARVAHGPPPHCMYVHTTPRHCHSSCLCEPCEPCAQRKGKGVHPRGWRDCIDGELVGLLSCPVVTAGRAAAAAGRLTWLEKGRITLNGPLWQRGPFRGIHPSSLEGLCVCEGMSIDTLRLVPEGGGGGARLAGRVTPPPPPSLFSVGSVALWGPSRRPHFLMGAIPL